MKKYFVLDSNVLLHNAAALEAFADNEVVIPIDVIQELDTFKSHNTELGRNARQVIRKIDFYRQRGSLREGVPINEQGGTLRVMIAPNALEGTGLSPDSSDNRIISVALALKKEGKNVILISKDMNARIKANALDINTADFEQQKVNFSLLYSGWKEASCPGVEIDALFGLRGPSPEPYELLPNQFLLMRDNRNPQHTALARCSPDGKELLPLRHAKDRPFGIAPRNREQQMALELLLTPEVELVTLIGQAATGKTLLSLAAALQQTLKERLYFKVLVSRPIMPLGRDIAYMPARADEKLESWQQPILDNLGYMFRSKETRGAMDRRIQDLFESNQIEIEALTYIRGRSIAGHYVIVDDAQNLTPHEVKTILGRAGEDTKVVLTGDPYQIDNPFLDANSNGLVYLCEKLKGHPLAGHVTLTTSERSNLAAAAYERL